MGMPISQTITSTSVDGGGNTAPFSLDWMIAPSNVTISVILVAGTTATYTLQFTQDDLNAVPPSATFTIATANWENDPDLNTLSTSGIKQLTTPYRFGRLNITGLTSGETILLRVVQGFSIN